MVRESRGLPVHMHEAISAALSTMSDMILIYDSSCRFVYGNQALLDLWNVTLDDLIGRPLRELVSDDEVADQLESHIHHVVEHGEKIVATASYTSPSGRHGIYEYILQPFQHEDGVWVVGSTRDISERLRLDHELQRSHRQSFEILESITDAFYALDRNWRFTYVNRRAGELLNRDPAELIGKDGWSEFPEARDYVVYEQFHKAMETQRARSFEYYFDPLDTWFEVHAYPSEDLLSVYFRRSNEKIRIQRELEASERRYRTLTDAMPQMVWLTDANGYHLYYNQRWYEYTGLSEQESLGFGFTNALHPDDLDRTLKLWERAWRYGERYEIEYRFYSRTLGEHRWFLGRAYPVHDSDGNIVEWVGTCTDIEHQKETERQLTESERRLAEAQRIARFGNWHYQFESDRFTFSGEAARIFDLASDEARDFRTFYSMIHPEDRAVVNVQQERLQARGGGTVDIEYRIRRSDGEERIVHTIAELEVDEHGNPVQIYGTVHDVTERKEIERSLQEYARQQQVMSKQLQQLNSTLEEQVEERTVELRRLSENLERLVWERTAELETSRAELSHQAQHDPLTGLPNRTLFEDRLDHAIEKAERAGTLVGVLFIDLDGFKLVNDSFGHSLGDGILTSVSHRMRGQMRRADTLARHGGDEFAVILEDLRNPEDALPIAQAILASLEQPFNASGRAIRLSASIGVSFYPQDGASVHALQRYADIAMYRAKVSGKNDIRFYSPSMNAATDERMEIAARLSTALERDELALHFQPQWLAGTQRIVAFEALLRWYNPDLGSVSPARLIPIAEEVGLMIEIGSWVLEESCRRAVEWTELTGQRVGVAVNISSYQLDREDFVDFVRKTLKRYGLEPGRLELELTESSVMHDMVIASRQMRQLRELGVRITMDDFGLGSSSLTNLVHLPLDSIKIDRGFIRDLPQSRAADRVVQAIVSLASGIGLEVVVEGIETAAQRDRIVDLGCRRLQGYLLGYPVELTKAIELLRIQSHSDF
jgi:diguanylate cyclase (GGDEF)-like protein/PAS domain S-box-containing protein